MAEPKIVSSITGLGDYLIIAGGESEDGMTNLVEIYRHPTLIHVPGDYATIQEAINVASYNDTILVADEPIMKISTSSANQYSLRVNSSWTATPTISTILSLTAASLRIRISVRL